MGYIKPLAHHCSPMLADCHSPIPTVASSPINSRSEGPFLALVQPGQMGSYAGVAPVLHHTRRYIYSTTLKSRSLISPSHFLLQQLLLLSTVDYSCLSSQSASTPILRFGLHYCSSPYLSIRLLHERDGSTTHHRGLPTTGGGEWLEFRSL